jgi:hypothetical protein
MIFLFFRRGVVVTFTELVNRFGKVRRGGARGSEPA